MKQEHEMTPGVLVSRVPGGAHPLYPKASVLIDADVSYSSDSAPLQQSTDAETIQRAADILGSQGMETWDQVAAELRTMLAAAPQAVKLRYTSDGALAECPCCGSLDVGGAHGTVNCYGCGLTVTKPRPLQNAIDAWNARTVRQQTPQAEQVVEPVAWLFDDGEVTLESDYKYLGAVRSKSGGKPLFTAPPTPDVSGLVEALGLLEVMQQQINGLLQYAGATDGYDEHADQIAALAAHKQGVKR